MEHPNVERARAFTALASEQFDIVVVGGGITGAGIARDAAVRGLKVALVEKLDFAAGTSSKSSKLVHGGLRYLEQAELKLVFESVNERALLMDRARHLVRPLPFLVTRFRGDKRWLVTLDLGLWIYDAMCLFRTYRLHRTYRAKKTLELEPGLKAEGLSGGILYYDCLTDDARLTLEALLDARSAGAVIVNHARAGALLRAGDTVTGIEVTDCEPLGSGATVAVKAKVVINATGPWSDEVRALAQARPILKPTKGVHIVVDAARLPVSHALMMASPKDKRVVFAIPWGLGRTVVGTTDTFYEGAPEDCHADRADAEYLLETANAYFPAAKLALPDVLSTWTGLRPLLAPPDAGTGASQVSREHVIEVGKGFLTIAGGKLTTFRRMATECVDAAAPQLGSIRPSATQDRPLPGSVGLATDDDFLALKGPLQQQGATAAQADALIHLYGVRSKDVLARAAADASALEPVDPEVPFVMAQVDEAIDVEFARTLDDVLSRRLPLVLRARDQGLGIAPKVAARMAQRLQWTPARTADELARYRAAVADSRRFRDA